jgi:sulfate adenylyltransferase subunit 2
MTTLTVQSANVDVHGGSTQVQGEQHSGGSLDEAAVLDHLESEAIYILREVAAEFQRPAILFSGGKDSICVLRLVQKAFWPETLRFPLLHIDTGHNFPEVIEFRDRLVKEIGGQLFVRTLDEAFEAGLVSRPPAGQSRNRLQSPVLLRAIAEFQFDAVIGGARRDEEKARAKERVFSLRDEFGQWNPRAQRPELWQTYNTLLKPGQSMRVFPLSNWTELDVWRYIRREKLSIPSIYFSHERPVFERGGQLIAYSEHTLPDEGVLVVAKSVRTRTVGDITCTGCIASSAASIDDIITELRRLRTTERASRVDDRFSATAMEDRKREGYF